MKLKFKTKTDADRIFKELVAMGAKQLFDVDQYTDEDKDTFEIYIEDVRRPGNLPTFTVQPAGRGSSKVTLGGTSFKQLDESGLKDLQQALASVGPILKLLNDIVPKLLVESKKEEVVLPSFSEFLSEASDEYKKDKTVTVDDKEYTILKKDNGYIRIEGPEIELTASPKGRVEFVSVKGKQLPMNKSEEYQPLADKVLK